jgi:hypothetical protein
MRYMGEMDMRVIKKKKRRAEGTYPRSLSPVDLFLTKTILKTPLSPCHRSIAVFGGGFSFFSFWRLDLVSPNLRFERDPVGVVGDGSFCEGRLALRCGWGLLELESCLIGQTSGGGK